MKTLREMIDIVESAQQPMAEAVPVIKGAPEAFPALNYANAIEKIAQNRITSATKMLTSKDPDDRYTAKVMMRDAKNWAQVAKAFELHGMQAGAEKFFELDDYDDLWEFLEDVGFDIHKDLMPLR